MTPHEQIVISALRYALDRRSYIMSSTEEYIRDMFSGKNKVSESFIQVAMDDIETHQRECVRLCYDTSGMHDWTPLFKFLQNIAPPCPSCGKPMEDTSPPKPTHITHKLYVCEKCGKGLSIG